MYTHLQNFNGSQNQIILPVSIPMNNDMGALDVMSAHYWVTQRT